VFASPTGNLPEKYWVHFNYSVPGMTSSWVVLGGVLFESDSKSCKRDKVNKYTLETSMPFPLPRSFGTWCSALANRLLLYCVSCSCSLEFPGCWISPLKHNDYVLFFFL
jgi:hypothetical protein